MLATMPHAFVSVAWLCLFPAIASALGSGTCDSSLGCDDDETSLLSSKLHHISRHTGKTEQDPTPAELTAARVFYDVLLTTPASNASQAWTNAVNQIVNCALGQVPGCPGIGNPGFQTALAEKNAQLADVPAKFGYKTTAAAIQQVASQFSTSKPIFYANVYAMVYAKTNTVVQAQLYLAENGTLSLTVDHVTITGLTYKPGSQGVSQGKLKTVGLPSVLTWSQGGGNPTSGSLSFNYIFPVSQGLPANAYTGPYFSGQISGQDVFGVVFQNDVVNCGVKASNDQLLVNIDTLIKRGASQKCLSGTYCITANRTAESSDFLLHPLGVYSESLYETVYNLTIGADTLQLADKAIPTYVLSNSKFTWKASTSNPYAGFITVRRGTNGVNQLFGRIQKKGEPVYEVTGYVPKTGSSCYKAPPVSAWWKGVKAFGKLVGEGAAQGLGTELVTDIAKGEIPFHGLYEAWQNWRNKTDEKPKDPPEIDGDDANPQISPKDVEAFEDVDEEIAKSEGTISDEAEKEKEEGKIEEEIEEDKKDAEEFKEEGDTDYEEAEDERASSEEDDLERAKDEEEIAAQDDIDEKEAVTEADAEEERVEKEESTEEAERAKEEEEGDGGDEEAGGDEDVLHVD